MRYMAREVTCIFILIYTVVLVIGFAALTRGPEAYDVFMASLRSPLSVVFHVLALAFSVYHSVTWFNLTPKALPVQMGERFLPGAVIAGAHYALWIILSLWILWLAGAF
jgi:fumarate reductase subunit C